MSIRTFRALVCDAPECRAAPSTEALIMADENKGVLPDGWELFTADGRNYHTCPVCSALGRRPEVPCPPAM